MTDDYVLVGFVLTGLTQLIKLGDFLLTPPQQDAFQKKVERLVRILHSVRPIRVFEVLRRRPGQWLVIAPMVTVGGILAVVNLRGQIQDVLARETSSLSLVLDAIAEASMILLGTAAIIVLAVRIWRRETAGFLDGSSGRRWRIAFRTLGFVAFGFAPLAVVLVRQAAAPVGELAVSNLSLILASVLSVVGVLWLAPAIAIALSVVFWLLAFLGYGVMLILRGFGERIIQYQKGAWGAVLLLAAITFGVATAYLKFATS